MLYNSIIFNYSVVTNRFLAILTVGTKTRLDESIEQTDAPFVDVAGFLQVLLAILDWLATEFDRKRVPRQF